MPVAIVVTDGGRGGGGGRRERAMMTRMVGSKRKARELWYS